MEFRMKRVIAQAHIGTNRYLVMFFQPLISSKSYSRTLVMSADQKNNFLISQPNICCGYLKEPSQ